MTVGGFAVEIRFFLILYTLIPLLSYPLLSCHLPLLSSLLSRDLESDKTLSLNDSSMLMERCAELIYIEMLFWLLWIKLIM